MNNDFFFEIDFDENNRISNVFWANARSRAACEEFGDVVSLDTTYLTNNYDMPFAPFVGVNHHGQSILLGCRLLSTKDTLHLCGFFNVGISACQISHQMVLMAYNAIEIIFPNSHHRWCLWYIMKKKS